MSKIKAVIIGHETAFNNEHNIYRREMLLKVRKQQTYYKSNFKTTGLIYVQKNNQKINNYVYINKRHSLNYRLSTLVKSTYITWRG